MHYSSDQYILAGSEMSCEAEMVEAVCTKEVIKKLTFRHGGKDVSKILYEKHVLWDLLDNPREILRQNPAFADVLGQSPYTGYGKYIKQYQRRERACLIDREAAFGACSYSGFQIMGYHHKRCGYDSAEVFAIAMDDPANHIPAFIAFIKSDDLLLKCLQTRDFEGFARRYNGRDYWKKGYHIELAKIYQRIIARNLPRHESKLAAVVQSGTIQRGAAITGTAALPAAPVLMENDSLSNLVTAVQAWSEKGQELGDQVKNLQASADSLAPMLEWLPWAAGGWTALLLLIFGLLVQRYLRDRGYIG